MKAFHKHQSLLYQIRPKLIPSYQVGNIFLCFLHFTLIYLKVMVFPQESKTQVHRYEATSKPKVVAKLYLINSVFVITFILIIAFLKLVIFMENNPWQSFSFLLYLSSKTFQVFFHLDSKKKQDGFHHSKEMMAQIQLILLLTQDLMFFPYIFHLKETLEEFTLENALLKYLI